MTRKTITATLVIAGAVLLFSVMAAPASAQDISVVAPTAESGLSMRVVQLFVLVTVLSMAPGIAMMVTCLPFMLIVSLALFLTSFVMEPVFSEAWKSGVQPLLDHDITEAQAFERTLAPFETFMERRVNPAAIDALSEVAPQKAAEDGKTPVSVLIPAFMLSEIQHAFEIGFVIFLPFLIIDLVVASILMAMGMMMVPPAVVSLPFKLAFFVLANGWIEIAGAVVKGYST